MDKKVKSYLYTEYYKGKNAFARTTDMILGKVFTLLMLFGAAFAMGLRVYSCVVVALAGTGIFIVADVALKKRSFTRFCNKYMKNLETELLLEKLSLLPEEELKKVFLPAFTKREGEPLQQIHGGFYSQNSMRLYSTLSLHPTQSATVADVRNVHSSALKSGAKSVCLLSLGGFDEQAKLLCKKLPFPLELLDKDYAFEVAEQCGFCITKEECHSTLLALYEQRKSRREGFGAVFFSAGKTKVYLLGGILLSIWPIIVGFNVIYPVMSSLCFIMATRGFFMDINKKKN